MRETLKQIRAHILSNAPLTAQVLGGRARAGVFLGRLVLRILRQWARDRCPQQASALAFQTSLSLVPLLAVAFALLHASGAEGAEHALLNFVGEQILPDLGDVAEQLHHFSHKISQGAVGAAGLLVTLITCYSLYASVEHIVNDIWKSSRKRTLVPRFLTFYALVTLLPFLAGTSLYWSGRLAFAGTFTRFAVPLTIQFAALLLTNKLLPTVTVRWWAALSGATFTAVALESTKLIFVTFAKRMLLNSYTGIYGAIGLLPMLLLWIYLSWVLVLLGVEIASAAQNQRRLEAEERRQRDEEPVNGLVASQLFVAITDHYNQGGRGLTQIQLSEQFQLAPHTVVRMVDRLKARGLIAEVQGDKEGYIPARAAESITLDDILGAFRTNDRELVGAAMPPALARLIAELNAARAARTQGVVMASLLPPRAISVPEVPSTLDRVLLETR